MLAKPMFTKKPTIARVQSYAKLFEVTDGCWNWRGSTFKGRANYGRLNYLGRHLLAHRFMYGLIHGEPALHLVVDHLCNNKKCVNPNHLELKSSGANSLRGNSPPANNRRKSRCVEGHELSGDNLRTRKDGARICITCSRARRNEMYREERAAIGKQVYTDKRRPSCKNGHKYTERNTKLDVRGWRICLQCKSNRENVA